MRSSLDFVRLAAYPVSPLCTFITDADAKRCCVQDEEERRSCHVFRGKGCRDLLHLLAVVP